MVNIKIKTKNNTPCMCISIYIIGMGDCQKIVTSIPGGPTSKSLCMSSITLNHQNQARSQFFTDRCTSACF